MYISNINETDKKQYYLRGNNSNATSSKKAATAIKDNVINAAVLNNEENEINKQNAPTIKAMRKKISTFTTKQNTDDSLKSMYKNIEELRDEAKSLTEEKQSNNDTISKIMSDNGIDEDSKEYADLKILAKEQAIQSGYSTEELTDDEKKQLSKIEELTSFQQRGLEIDARNNELDKKLEDVNNKISGCASAISAIKINNLKTHEMVDAEKEEKASLLQSAKDLIGKILEKGKETVDALTDETKKEEEKKEEEIKQQESTEQKTDSTSDSSTNNQEIPTDKILNAETNHEELTNQIETLIKAKQLTPDDVMGVTIDEQL